jgi:hypothetical protein
VIFSQEGELPLDTQAIIATLDSEIARLREARAILTATASVTGAASSKRGPGRPKTLATVARTRRRVLSPEAKEKIAAAQKARWAKAKKAAKKAAKAEAAA